MAGDVGLRGKLLIAMPHMDDENFQNSVIFVTEHNAEGAMGFVLNSLDSSVTLPQMFKQLKLPQLAAGEGAPRFPTVRTGGPCSPGHGFVLHGPKGTGAQPMQFDGTETVDARFQFTVSTDVLREIALGSGPERFIVLLGYSGWGPGQLEDELRDNVWLHAEATTALIFEGDPGTLWERSLAHLGVSPAHLSPVAGFA